MRCGSRGSDSIPGPRCSNERDSRYRAHCGGDPGDSRRIDSGAVFITATLGYLLVYLVTIGDLGLASRSEYSIRIVGNFSRPFMSLGFGRFEAIALVRWGPITYLFSPLNVIVALLLSVLVGSNLALTYLGWVQPKACGLESSGGVVGAVPALLSGAAYCGPTILLVFGIQASSVLITGFQLFVPLAVVLLIASLLLIGRQVDPTLLHGARSST